MIRFAFRLLLGRRLPPTQGCLTVPGLRGAVRIHRDRHGIPLVDADDDGDGPFAVGFCHGQDRAFQLEVLLRVVRGTVAEMVGPTGVGVDRLSRRIGFHRSAEQQWPALDADVRARLEAYACGVQAGVSLGSPQPAHEFVLLGARPTPWSPLDTLAVTKLLSFTLTANWDAELVRLKVLAADGPEALRALDPEYPSWLPVAAPVGAAAGRAADRLAEDLAAFLAWAPPGGGSNNWAVTGSRTATGRPLLACDPHLDARVPAHWYLISVRTPTAAVAGATFVGGPTALVGHNGTACWGLTAGLVDNTDLFIEEIGPDGASVRHGDAFVACPVVEEVIAVKGAAAVTERVLLTPRGPVIGPALAETTQAVSLRATWLDALPVRGLFAMEAARSFAEFRAAFAHWPLASQNMAYADTAGTIGWQLIGRVPRRKKGFGTLPLYGADPDAGWHDDPVPFEDVPYLQDPPCGYLATANTRPVPDGCGPFLGVDFLDGYRLAAILRALAARDDWDVAATMALQTDQRAVAWEELRDAVLAATPADDDGRTALRLLRLWDGRVTADSPAAAVYELWLAGMAGRIARARAPASWRWVLGAGLTPLTPHNPGCYRRTAHLVGLLRERPAGWFDQPWPEIVVAALADAARELRTRFGADPAGWAWGSVRPLLLRHPLARRPGLLGRALGWVFNLGPIPCGGDCDVINQAAAPPLAPLAPAENLPSLRAVFDVGAWHNSRFVLPGGQSGNPLSPHYADLFELWRQGAGVPIAFTPAEVRAAAVQTLQLRPG